VPWTITNVDFVVEKEHYSNCPKSSLDYGDEQSEPTGPR